MDSSSSTKPSSLRISLSPYFTLKLNNTFATLCANEEKEVIHYLFDGLFTENLQQITSLKQMNAAFLVQAIRDKREKISCNKEKEGLAFTLNTYERALTENISETMHGLILYLGWDRCCVCMAHLFDYQTNEPKFIQNIALLWECLIESYQHIFLQGRTRPGIYRMFEACLFYQMREENLHALTADEWELVNQSFQLLKPEEELMDCFYIDDAIAMKNDEDAECYATVDSSLQVQTKVALAKYMIDKIKRDFPSWNFSFNPKKIIHLTNSD